jgi:hypothetical protein
MSKLERSSTNIRKTSYGLGVVSHLPQAALARGLAPRFVREDIEHVRYCTVTMSLSRPGTQTLGMHTLTGSKSSARTIDDYK